MDQDSSIYPYCYSSFPPLALSRSLSHPVLSRVDSVPSISDLISPLFALPFSDLSVHDIIPLPLSSPLVSRGTLILSPPLTYALSLVPLSTYRAMTRDAPQSKRRLPPNMSVSPLGRSFFLWSSRRSSPNLSILTNQNF